MTGHLNYGRALRLAASKHGNQVFLEYGSAPYTYQAFNQQVNSVAAWMQSRGLRSKDRLLVVSTNSPDYVRVLFAAAKLGITTVPASSMLRAEGLAALLEVSAPALVLLADEYAALGRDAIELLKTPPPQIANIGQDLFRPSIRQSSSPEGFVPDATTEPVPDLEPSDDDPATVLFTSGSSGAPKGVVKSYGNLMWHALNRQIAEPRVTDDRELFVLPLTGIGFANFILTDVLTGATCVLEPFEPVRVAALLGSGGITHAFLAPTMLSAIERKQPGIQFPSVRVVETAYEMPLYQREMAVRQFPNARILYSYGMSEGSMARSPAERFLRDLSCVGYASGLDEYRVAGGDDEDGMREIIVAGPTVMQGYLAGSDRELEHPLRDGWLHTGDLGWIDHDGACHFGGRAKDMIKSGGVSIFAADVETALIEHPSVTAVAVIGVPDEYWGEAVVAVLEADRWVDLDEIRAFASRRLSSYQLPKAYYLTSQMPLNHTGKIAKGEVREMVEHGAFARVG